MEIPERSISKRIYHNPPHIYIDNTIYIITASTYKKYPYFETPKKKEILLEKIWEGVERLGFQMYAWIILDNHYHILIKIQG